MTFDLFSKQIENIVKIAEKLDANGNEKLASKIDGIVNNFLDIKTSQYVGGQGYWIRNVRCWSNCYRHKRAQSPNSPTQEVISDCHKEYVQSISDPKSDWQKYAQSSSGIKTSNQADKYLDQEISYSIQNRLNAGMEPNEAVYSGINDFIDKKISNIITASADLSEISNELLDSDFDSSKTLALASGDLLKQAQFWDKAKDYARNLGNSFTGKNLSPNNSGMGASVSNFGKTDFSGEGSQKHLYRMIGQLEATLANYRAQRYNLDYALLQAEQGGGSFANVAKEIRPLLKNLNSTSLAKMRSIVNNLNQTSNPDAPIGEPPLSDAAMSSSQTDGISGPGMNDPNGSFYKEPPAKKNPISIPSGGISGPGIGDAPGSLYKEPLPKKEPSWTPTSSMNTPSWMSQMGNSSPTPPAPKVSPKAPSKPTGRKAPYTASSTKINSPNKIG